MAELAYAADLKSAEANPTSAEHSTNPVLNCGTAPLAMHCTGGVELVRKAADSAD
jgi:hypothetical protein